MLDIYYDEAKKFPITEGGRCKLSDNFEGFTKGRNGHIVKVTVITNERKKTCTRMIEVQIGKGKKKGRKALSLSKFRTLFEPNFGGYDREATRR